MNCKFATLGLLQYSLLAVETWQNSGLQSLSCNDFGFTMSQVLLTDFANQEGDHDVNCFLSIVKVHPWFFLSYRQYAYFQTT